MRILISIIFGLLVVFTSCEQFGSCYGVDCTSPPNPIRLSVISGDTDLIYSNYYHMDSIGIFYKSENGDYYQLEHYTHIDTVDQRAIIACVEMAFKSLEGYDKFIIKYNSYEYDSAYLKVISVTENCCNFHPISAFTINNEVPAFNNEFHCFLIDKELK